MWGRCAHYTKSLVAYMLGLALIAVGGMLLLLMGCESMWIRFRDSSFFGWARGFYHRFRLEVGLFFDPSEVELRTLSLRAPSGSTHPNLSQTRLSQDPITSERTTE